MPPWACSAAVLSNSGGLLSSVQSSAATSRTNERDSWGEGTGRRLPSWGATEVQKCVLNVMLLGQENHVQGCARRREVRGLVRLHVHEIEGECEDAAGMQGYRRRGLR